MKEESEAKEKRRGRESETFCDLLAITCSHTLFLALSACDWKDVRAEQEQIGKRNG